MGVAKGSERFNPALSQIRWQAVDVCRDNRKRLASGNFFSLCAGNAGDGRPGLRCHALFLFCQHLLHVGVRYLENFVKGRCESAVLGGGILSSFFHKRRLADGSRLIASGSWKFPRLQPPTLNDGKRSFSVAVSKTPTGPLSVF